MAASFRSTLLGASAHAAPLDSELRQQLELASRKW
jgi:hypothetical protein